jgi:hypothetical protein
MVLAFWGMAVASGIHAAEEYVYPGGFLRWMRSVFPRSAPGGRGAIVINGAFFVLVFSPLISDPQVTPVFSMSIATLLLANGALHVAGTYLTGRYSPGVITSVLCYFPAAIFTWITIPPQVAHGSRADCLGNPARRLLATGSACVDGPAPVIPRGWSNSPTTAN